MTALELLYALSGTQKKTKEELMRLADIYLAAGRITEDGYKKFIDLLNKQ